MPDFQLHSGVRKRHTRLKRVLAPTHAALVQHIGGLIVRRTRPVRISEAKALEILPQLKAAEAEGRLELRTMDGRLVDLESMQPVVEVTPSPLLPHPLLDSAARDKPSGIPMPAYYEGTGQVSGTAKPSLITDSEKDGEDQESDEDDGEDDTEEQDVPTNPDAAPVPVVEDPAKQAEPKLLKNRRGAR